MDTHNGAWWLPSILHSFPHLDLTFRWTNSTFNLYNAQYRESLVFWAAIPVLWLLLTLLVFLIYFCYRCCQKDNEKKRHAVCLQWTMAILALVICGGIGVGFFGNEESHNGITILVESTRKINISINSMHTRVINMENSKAVEVERNLENLRTILTHRNTAMNQTLKKQIRKMFNFANRGTRNMLNSVQGINSGAQQVNFERTADDIETWEYYRWVTLIGLLCWELALCLLLLLGIGRTSKCTLLLFCALGIFTLVLGWAAAGVHLGSSVALGDFCVAPDAFIERKATQHFKKDIVQYYTKCDSYVRNPFSGSLKSAIDSITSANNTLNSLTEIAFTYVTREEVNSNYQPIQQGFDNLVNILHQLTALVQCTNINKDYRAAVDAICYRVLPGTCFLLLSAVLVALLLTKLVLLASCAWRHFGRRDVKENSHIKGYCEVDEDDPFIPRGTSLSAATSSDNTSPNYYSFTRSRPQGRDQAAAVHRRSSPPPASGQQPTAGMMIGKTNSMCLHNRAGILVGRHHHTPGNANRMSVPQPVSIPVSMLQHRTDEYQSGSNSSTPKGYSTLKSVHSHSIPSHTATLPHSGGTHTLPRVCQPHIQAGCQPTSTPSTAATNRISTASVGAPQTTSAGPIPVSIPAPGPTAPTQPGSVTSTLSNNSTLPPLQPSNTNNSTNQPSDWPNHPPPWTSL